MRKTMNQYEPAEIEKKWQDKWQKTKAFEASVDFSKPKYYALVEFPYPSGDGLHVGHVRGYTAMDIIARKRRAEGFNVLYPMGWDAFGLPAENYAIKTGTAPSITTKENIEVYKKQIISLGLSFDWSREINTTDPEYYKWTQWLFLQFLKHDLAYKAKAVINWCPKDRIGLANEEVVAGCCERCGTAVEKREKEQWMLAITKYADKLDKDLDTVDYLPQIKLQQKNWIGKSEGAEISFQFSVLSFQSEVTVFTTRPETIFGATYIVLAPEHPLLNNPEFIIENREEVESYVRTASQKTDLERGAEGKEKTGVELKGVKAINPATKQEIPIWIADYVLGNYGTGAVMAVPAHDERDFEFAKKFNLSIKQVIAPVFVDTTNPPKQNSEDTIRHGVIMVVKHWSENKYLLNYSPKFNWKCLFTGGIEDGEDPLTAAEREIREETGYQNIKETRYIELEHIDKFHAPHKGENRTAYQKNIFIQLKDGETKERTPEEIELHQLSWLTEAEMKKTISLPNHLYIYETYLKNGQAMTEEGVCMNSKSLDGLGSTEAKKQATVLVGGKTVTRFKLRDWVFSRQRYWGEPIPVIHCEMCGIVPVPEKDLPVTLPIVERYLPTDNGESPLAEIDSWVNVPCPSCNEPAKRETDVMPNWAGSSWYFLRYTDPNNSESFAGTEALKYWTPVDWYNGGMEHTTLHLLYSRFWNKFLYDQGLVPTSEPYAKRTSHGLILAEGGEKMSKSKGNVINPDGIVKLYGADTLRIYEMFMGPFNQPVTWSTESIIGPRRFLDRTYRLGQEVINNKPEVTNNSNSLDSSVHKTIQKVSEDIEAMRFNTAVSTLMVLLNEFEKTKEVSKNQFSVFVKLLSPFAPHLAEELWETLGNTGSISKEPWPIADKTKIQSEISTITIQVNGKMRAVMQVSPEHEESVITERARNTPEVAKWLNGKSIKRVIFVKGKMLNFVV